MKPLKSFISETVFINRMNIYTEQKILTVEDVVKRNVVKVFFHFHYPIYYTAWKVSKYGVFSGPYFPAFGLNTERYEVSLCIQFECEKIRTRKNSVFRHFSCSVRLPLFSFWFSKNWLCQSTWSIKPVSLWMYKVLLIMG